MNELGEELGQDKADRRTEEVNGGRFHFSCHIVMRVRPCHKIRF